MVDVYSNVEDQPVPQPLGLFFSHTALPRNARLTAAYIEFSAAQVTKKGNDAKLVIHGIDADTVSIPYNVVLPDMSFITPTKTSVR